MGRSSGIEWLRRAGGPPGATWNPHQGCEHVSPGCDACYMFAEKTRYGQDPSRVVRSAPGTFYLPRKLAPGTLVFVCSWSDFFHRDADEYRDEEWAVMRERPDLIFIIVTKRHGRIARCLPSDWGDGWPNVWLLVSAENQEWADRRVAELLTVPAAVRGVSAEPLLGPIHLPYQWLARLDWIIYGGESHGLIGARATHLEWFDSLVSSALQLPPGVRPALFAKQTGARPRLNNGLVRITSHKGNALEDFPPHLRFREFPDQRPAPSAMVDARGGGGA